MQYSSHGQGIAVMQGFTPVSPLPCRGVQVSRGPLTVQAFTFQTSPKKNGTTTTTTTTTPPKSAPSAPIAEERVAGSAAASAEVVAPASSPPLATASLLASLSGGGAAGKHPSKDEAAAIATVLEQQVLELHTARSTMLTELIDTRRKLANMGTVLVCHLFLSRCVSNLQASAVYVHTSLRRCLSG